MYAVAVDANGSLSVNKEITMNGAIKESLINKVITYSEQYGVDEERQLVAFEPSDLISLINDVIQICADMVVDPDNRLQILKLGNLK